MLHTSENNQVKQVSVLSVRNCDSQNLFPRCLNTILCLNSAFLAQHHQLHWEAEERSQLFALHGGRRCSREATATWLLWLIPVVRATGGFQQGSFSTSCRKLRVASSQSWLWKRVPELTLLQAPSSPCASLVGKEISEIKQKTPPQFPGLHCECAST